MIPARAVRQATDIVTDDGRFLLVLGALGAVVWLYGLHQVDVSRMGDLGVITILPASGLVGLTALGISLPIALMHRRRTSWLPATLLGTLIVLLYGLTAMIEHEPRFAPVWRHAGFVDYVLRTGALDSRVDVYFSWPGFFVALAFVSAISDVHDMLQLLTIANWAPVFFNLSYAVALYFLYSSLTKDDRVKWLALWFFILNNWIAQDYLAPQALAYLLYLVTIAMLLRWFRTAPMPPAWLARFFGPYSQVAPLVGLRRTTLLLGALAVFTATVMSHPLTPLFAISATALLVMFAGVRPWWLPLSLFGIAAVWDVIMTRDYVATHPSVVSDVLASVSSKVDASVSQHVVGSVEHLLVVRLRLVMTAFVGLLALIGSWRCLRAGNLSLPAAVLAVAPLPVFAIQSYGGEMLLRVVLFTLPLLSFFAACAFYPRPSSTVSWWKAAALLLLAVGTLQVFLLTRFGNERQDYVSPEEAQAAVRLYEIAPPDSVLVLMAGAPLKYRDVEKYGYENLSERDLERPTAGELTARLRSRNQPAFFLVTRGEKAFADMSLGVPSGSLGRLQRSLEESSDWNVVYRNRDAEILLFVPPGTKSEGLSSLPPIGQDTENGRRAT